MKYFPILLIFFILLPICVFSEIYIWTDANGVKHVSDSPPKQSETVTDYRSLESSPVTPKKTVESTKKDTSSQSVTGEKTGTLPQVAMFTQTDNANCEKARQWFKDHNVDFKELNIDASPTIKTAYEEIGGKSIPLIIINEEKVQGWDETKVKALLQIQ